MWVLCELARRIYCMVFKEARQGEQCEKYEFEEIAESEPSDGLVSHKIKKDYQKWGRVKMKWERFSCLQEKGGHQYLRRKTVGVRLRFGNGCDFRKNLHTDYSGMWQ